MGGDVGIAFATTFIARRSQVHQSYLVSHTDRFGMAFVARLQALTAAFERAGASSTQAARRALVMVYRQVAVEATTLAYVDVLRWLGIAVLLMIPMVALAGRRKAGTSVVGH